ncbi:integrase catalytic domain-containing protein [Trichonephila clavipes]|nr:integrase catalytic domain-containing protein [Trichonephila clavipes]
MLLRKWRSNSKQFNLLWQQEGVKTESSETSAIDLRPPTKVLGLAWDPENDLIYFDPKDLLKFMSRRGESKRFILSVVGRIFDPIGILGPFVIKLKCLLQELWTLGVEWDSELHPKLRHKWQQWSGEAEGLTEIKIPRFYLGKDNPADLLSRGTSAVKLAQNELWWHGPPWLKLTPDHWPNRHRDILDSELCSEELEHRSTEILVLKQKELRSSSEIKSLVPYLDENNLLRLTGRLLEADLCFGEKHPVILPRRCKFTELLVIREHERIGHCGVSATLTQLRKKYWVPKGRQLEKTMIRICLLCKKYSAKPADQLSGQLPRDRITQSPPFQSVGIDFTDKGIHWKFIVERAPWWGGFYERLVKTIKDPLRKILGRALLTFEELSTILSEVEVIVNHRPLTYVENDPGEPEPLTPAHFLKLGYGDSKYPIHFIELIDATTAKESYKKKERLTELFFLKQLWRRWKEQYLLQLKTANHFKTPSVHKNLKLNDVVLVEGNVKSKLLWELGIIKEIFIGRDDNVRSCKNF